MMKQQSKLTVMQLTLTVPLNRQTLQPAIVPLNKGSMKTFALPVSAAMLQPWKKWMWGGTTGASQNRWGNVWCNGVGVDQLMFNFTRWGLTK